MIRRFARLAHFCISAVLLLGTDGAARAQDAPAQPVRVAIATEKGTVEVQLDAERAPVTTANFLRYAQERRFDGTSFYRVMRLPWGAPPNGLIQGGTQMDPKRILPPIAHEPTTETGIRHKAGTISMARYDPGTATGDFTIMLSDMPGLDADPASANTSAGAGFAAFGQVVSGMDVVQAIYDAPLSQTKGEGVVRGQMIEDPVKILSVRRVTPAQTTP